jgi:hypothetical protein
MLALYLVLMAAMTWPVAAHLGSRVAGANSDAHQYVWTFWRFRRDILSGGSPFYTRLIFYPQGISTVSHSSVVIQSLLAFVLQGLLSPVATYNVTLLISMVTTAYTSWLLLRYLVRDGRAAFLGSIVFACSPVYMSQAAIGHINYTSAGFIPLFLLFFLRARDLSRLRDAALGGLFLSLTALSNWAYGLFGYLILVLHFAYHLIRDRVTLLRGPVVRIYVFVAGIGAIIVLPAAIPFLESSGEVAPTRYIGAVGVFVADLAGFLIPSQYHPLFGDLARSIGDHTGGANSYERTVFLGFSVLALAVYGARRSRSVRLRFWVVVALLFGILSLGPRLHILGKSGFPWLSWLNVGSTAVRLGVPMKPEWVQMFDEAPPLPLPGAALLLLPAFSTFRAPSRLAVYVMLALGILASYGTADLLERLRNRCWLHAPAPWVCTCVLSGLVAFEFCILPFPHSSAAVPDFYASLRGESAEFGVLELPIRPYDPMRQYYQVFHDKPLAYGHLSRLPEWAFAQIDALEQEIEQPTGYFREVDIRYIVLHTGELAQMGDAGASLLTTLNTGYELIGTWDTLRVYRAY